MDVAYEDLVRVQYEPLRRAAFALCGDRQQADDLVQTAFVRAHRQSGRVLSADDPAAYLHRILINASRSWWSRRREHAALSDGPDPTDDLGWVDLRMALVTALRALTRDQREAVVLRHLLGRTEQETALALGCPVGTVKSRTSRALVALRAVLSVDAEEMS